VRLCSVPSAPAEPTAATRCAANRRLQGTSQAAHSRGQRGVAHDGVLELRQLGAAGEVPVEHQVGHLVGCMGGWVCGGVGVCRGVWAVAAAMGHYGRVSGL